MNLQSPVKENGLKWSWRDEKKKNSFKLYNLPITKSENQKDCFSQQGWYKMKERWTGHTFLKAKNKTK